MGWRLLCASTDSVTSVTRLQAVVRWVGAQEHTTHEEQAELLRLVRYPLLPHDYVLSTVQRETLAETQPRGSREEGEARDMGGREAAPPPLPYNRPESYPTIDMGAREAGRE